MPLRLVLKKYSTYFKLGGIAILITAITFTFFQVRGLYLEALSAARESGYSQAESKFQRELLEFRTEQEIMREALFIENRMQRQQLEREINLIKQERRALEQRLYKDNDLDILLQARPEWVLDIIQEGTNERLEQLEEITK